MVKYDRFNSRVFRHSCRLCRNFLVSILFLFWASLLLWAKLRQFFLQGNRFLRTIDSHERNCQQPGLNSFKQLNKLWHHNCNLTAPYRIRNRHIRRKYEVDPAYSIRWIVHSMNVSVPKEFIQPNQFEFRIPDGRVWRIDLLLQQREEPGEVGQDEGLLLWRHLVLLGSELAQELLPHGLESFRRALISQALLIHTSWRNQVKFLHFTVTKEKVGLCQVPLYPSSQSSTNSFQVATDSTNPNSNLIIGWSQNSTMKTMDLYLRAICCVQHVKWPSSFFCPTLGCFIHSKTGTFFTCTDFF